MILLFNVRNLITHIRHYDTYKCITTNRNCSNNTISVKMTERIVFKNWRGHMSIDCSLDVQEARQCLEAQPSQMETFGSK